MGVWMGPRGANADKKAPVFECTGALGTDYLYSEETVSGVTRWEIAVLKSCNFTFRRVGKVDMTLVGAGENGATGQCALNTVGILNADGGDGGAGGKVLRLIKQTLPKNTTLNAVIGGTGGAATTFNGKSSATGQAGKAGGDGAEQHGNSAHVDAYDGDSGVSAFASGTSMLFSGVLFGPGGGGGAAANTSAGTGYGAGDGGNTGGGDGGDKDHRTGYSGTANRGAGGGGGFGGFVDGAAAAGGAGGSGILLIRGSITA